MMKKIHFHQLQQLQRPQLSRVEDEVDLVEFLEDYCSVTTVCGRIIPPGVTTMDDDDDDNDGLWSGVRRIKAKYPYSAL
jgi:hypothetical protein